MNRTLGLLAVLLLTGCGSESESETPDAAPTNRSSSLMVTNPVLREFAVAAFPDDWTITELDVAPGQSALPSRAVIGEIQQASLVLWNGADFEPWRAMVSLPSSRQQEATAGWKDRLLTAGGAVAHQHGPNGAQQTGPRLWAVWLDPDLAARQLQTVADAATRRVATQSAAADDASQQRVSGLRQQLLQLGERYDAIRMQTPRRVLITDEQLGYLIRRLDWEAEVRPQASVDELGDFDLLLQTQSAEPSSSDPRSVIIDLCVAADDKTLIERLTANVDRLERGLSSLTADSAAAKD